MKHKILLILVLTSAGISSALAMDQRRPRPLFVMVFGGSATDQSQYAAEQANAAHASAVELSRAIQTARLNRNEQAFMFYLNLASTTLDQAQSAMRRATGNEAIVRTAQSAIDIITQAMQPPRVQTPPLRYNLEITNSDDDES